MIRWLTAFLDTPRSADPGWLEFWTSVTATTLSSRRGEHGQFGTLVPAYGDAYVRAQDIDDGSAGAHLDLHVDDIHTAADEASANGAQVVGDFGDVIVLRSPAGLVFCVVEHQGEHVRPKPLADGGTRTLLDQICLDVPAALFDAELAWWSDLTGWAAHAHDESEFGFLDRPPGTPLRLLFQRIGTEVPRMHLDIASSDRDREVARHRTLGADLVAYRHEWAVLRDPAGREYCVTDRNPDTGQA
jgi:hypothetical protein